MSYEIQEVNRSGVYCKADYDTLENFISYYVQYNLIRSLNPKKILEIGIGSKTLSNYLKLKGFNIITCDYDKNLRPDVVADVRKLPFKENSFDVVVAFEVLEHLPFIDFRKSLIELKRVSKKYVIISIPYRNYYISIKTCLPRFFVCKTIFSIPLFFKKWIYNGVHYWEMGVKGYSKSKIRNIIINSGFNIIKECNPPLNKYHYFFVLEKSNK